MFSTVLQSTCQQVQLLREGLLFAVLASLPISFKKEREKERKEQMQEEGGEEEKEEASKQAWHLQRYLTH
jgi:hypothetical protein